MAPKRYALPVVLLALTFAGPNLASAELVSLLQNATFFAGQGPLINASHPTAEGDGARNTASLFAGQEGASLFAPYPVRQKQVAPTAAPIRSATQIERIRHLIAQAEAGPLGYDAVQHGAVIRPAKRPTEMTIQEIYDWIAATPGQPHAIGRYQFIPATLKRLVRKLSVTPDQVFNPRLQDQLGDVLLVEAGLHAFSRGEIERHAFMNNLAKIWAGLPKSNGLSHYDGLAGNKATMTWAHFETEMSRIFPG